MNHIFKKLIGLLGTASIFTSNLMMAVAAHGPINFAELGNQIVSSHGVIEQQQDTDHETVKLAVNELDQSTKEKIIFGLFDKATTTQAATSADEDALHQAQRLLINDLELFVANDEQHKDNTLFSKIDKTETTFGKAELAYMLSHPLTDGKQLEARKAFIQQLVENQSLFDACTKIVKQTKKSESAICSFWLATNVATKHAIDALYFNKSFLKSLNKNPYTLELGVRLGNLGTAYDLVGNVLLVALFAHLYCKKAKEFIPALKDAKNIPDSFSGFIIPTAKFFYWPLSLVSNIQEITHDPKLAADTAENRLAKKILVGFTSGFALIQSILLYFKIMNIKKSLTDANTVNKTTQFLQSNLMEAASLVSNAKAIQKLGKQYPAMEQAMLGMCDMQEQFGKSHTTTAQLLKLLQTSTFKGKPSFFSLSGRVLAANRLMETNKNDLVPFMRTVGELDAYLSIAKLYKQSQGQRVTYTFVDYVPGNNPYLKLQGFWNPVVNPNVAVPNDLELGKAGSMRNIVLTGSNTAGKSTLLKAILTARLFAQTICIVPASRASITPCYFIASSLNIVDNTGQGDSLYLAEVKRSNILMKAAQAMHKAGLPCFIVMDELFRGTKAEVADKLTYDFGLNLTNYPTTSFILATHYLNSPIKLEKDTKGACRNYKIDAYVADNGTLVRPFKIEPGISTNVIAAEILEQSKQK